MKIENQCCTFKQAMRLKDLGINQDGFFVYRHWRGNGQINVDVRKEKYYDYSKHRNIAPFIGNDVIVCAAFTVAELGLMLGEHRAMVIENVDNTEAIDRANHLIMLLENNSITAEEVNKRLVNEEQKQVQ